MIERDATPGCVTRVVRPSAAAWGMPLGVWLVFLLGCASHGDTPTADATAGTPTAAAQGTSADPARSSPPLSADALLGVLTRRDASAPGDGRARLGLTSAGRGVLVDVGRFQSSAGDWVTYLDLDVQDGVEALRMEVLRGVAESALVRGESAQVRCIDGPHWADYAGLEVERGFACLERRRVSGDMPGELPGEGAPAGASTVDVVELVVPRGAARVRLLLWHGFWRDQFPSIEESILRADAAKLPADD
jgi:hypothetical protein